MQAKLGDVIQYDGRPFRIVRVIDKSISLFEQPDGICTVVEESYVELKGSDNSIEFLVINKQTRPYEGEPQPIKALDPIIYVKESKDGETPDPSRSPYFSEGAGPSGRADGES